MTTTQISYVIIDYGCVISYPQPPAAVDALLVAAGGDSAQTLERFWRHRLAYDRGDLVEHEFWSLVTQRELVPDDPHVTTLVDLDVASWSHVRPETLTAMREFQARGLPLALLSNTPAPHANWMLSQPWSEAFSAHVFSYRLRTVKPDPAIFSHTLEQLDCTAEQAVFVDDRAENCDGARDIGIAAVHFRGPDDWDRVRALLG